MAAFTTLLALAAAVIAPAETFVEAPGPNGPLKGTMLSRAAGAPYVLLIPGSGPTDRDGNNTRGLKASSIKLLAEALAARGVNTVRVDKRGLYASAAAIPDANAVTIEDYASDVHAWIDSIRYATGAKCVWVLGHSEGGIVALEASQHSPDICGLILVSTPGRPLGIILEEQLKANSANAPILADAERVISELNAGRRVDAAKINPALLPLFHPKVQGLLISEFAIDPGKLIAEVHKPVLIVQGDRDLQVGTADAENLKRADPSAKLVIVLGSNHVLKQVTSVERGANLATYADPSLPLAPGIAAPIADFVLAAAR